MSSTKRAQALLGTFDSFIRARSLPRRSTHRGARALIRCTDDRTGVNRSIKLSRLSRLLSRSEPRTFVRRLHARSCNLDRRFPTSGGILGGFEQFANHTRKLSVDFRRRLLKGGLRFSRRGNALLVHGLPARLLSRLGQTART